MNFASITPISHERRSVTGTLPDGSTIVVSGRQSQAFCVNLCIVINGALVHDAEPSDSEKAEFYILLNRAWDKVSNATQNARKAAVVAAQNAGIF